MSAEGRGATNAIRTLVYAAGFGTIQTLAALRLDGVLSWLLWLNAARNAAVFAMVLVGVCILAAKHVEGDGA